MKLSIIIASYGPQSQKYLDRCLKSLENSILPFEHEVILVSSGEFVPASSNFSKIHQRIHLKERAHYPTVLKKGVEASKGEQIILCNDDLIFNKDCLAKMSGTLSMNPSSIINPLSNCDNGRLFNYSFDIARLPTKPHYEFDEISDEVATSIMEATTGWLPGVLASDYNCFYATMMTRKCWDDLGGMDEQFLTGQDDLDFCIRAREKGYQTVIVLNAFCFHFSGATAKDHMDMETRRENIRRFNIKHEGKARVPMP